MKKAQIDLEESGETLITASPYGVDGKWGWFVVFNSFICNMIVDGMQYTFANFLLSISATFEATLSSVSLIGSLLSGFYNFSGVFGDFSLNFLVVLPVVLPIVFQLYFCFIHRPVAGALGNKFGFRMVIITGSLISASGLMLSYFAPNVGYLCFFYGVLGGSLGFGMIYMASVITTSIYFEKYRALAASLSVCGTGVGTFVFAPMGTWLVSAWGWRYALVAEGAIILICILCGLSFKPLAFISVVPVSREPSYMSSEESIGTARRGSIYFTSDGKKLLPNDAYPTFKEALSERVSDDRRDTVVSVSERNRRISVPESLANFRPARIYSVVTSSQKMSLQLPSKNENKVVRCFRICCFNFWHCRCKYEDLTLGDRPLYRDDIFYGGSLTTLRGYSVTEPVSYHLSVTRVPDPQELTQHASRKCCVCHRAFLRTCVTMTGLHLLSSKVFIFLCISSFFYTMSLYLPYVFIRKLAKEHGISDSSGVWLVSALGISNTAGRLTSGIIKSFVQVNAAILAMSCLFVSGLSSFIFLIKVNLISLMLFSCIFGLFTAPFISLRPVIIVEFLGLEKLTNAFGLVLLSQGVASIIGPPIAGLLQENTGDCIYVVYLAGSLMVISALSLLASILTNKLTLK